MDRNKSVNPIIAGLVLLALSGCKDEKKTQTEPQASVKEVSMSGGSFNLKSIRNNKKERVKLMEKINASQGDILKYASPKTKGEIIAVLINSHLWDGVANPVKHYSVKHDEQKCEEGTVVDARKRAVLAALKWVQSKHDYENVMQHAEMMPAVDGEADWRANEAKVIAFLRQGETPKSYGRSDNFVPFAAKVTIQPSHYAENLRDIYRSLPSLKANANEPLTPVNVALLSSCTQVVVDQHGWQQVNVGAS
ncbi:hypothetical protein CE143_21915 [Photorhabdus luminescens]|uniref:Lipoprotein n=2 Tax=Photorhabdus TaxID=29487 RepID=A0A2S8Q3Y2_9GAMM|nr:MULTISPECIES: hypothetical protein [Photorhabdus]PQQ26865.1 hypothetical protein C6H66_08485 [Photorhabdus hindustanensis]QXF35542.1 hypothetical protein B0X70_21870 [Photorhabdus akhurstii]UJD77374.1 hypothetical protein CE143_21915 [Photorhabdus luminescens]